MSTTATVIEPGRLTRALRLTARRVGPRRAGEPGELRFVVSGSGHARHVVLGDDGARACDCEDSIYRGTSFCKHVLAVLIRQGDRTVLDAIADLAEAGLAAVQQQ